MPDSSSDGDASAGGGSVIPINRGTQFSGGSLVLNSGLPGGPSPSPEPYELLGLRTSSSPTSILPNPAADVGVAPSALSFSLSGDINLVPIDNLATGGGIPAPGAIPEPSAGVMLGICLAGLALARGRKVGLGS